MSELSAAFGMAPETAPDPYADQVRAVWNLLGGRIDWHGVEIMCEMIGADDPELIIRGLAQIRDHFQEKRLADSSD